MSQILVSGIVNVETTLKVDSFPLTYEPVRYPFWGIQSNVSGVGYNITKALTTLGSTVNFVSFTGQDRVASIIYQELDHVGVHTDFLFPELTQTPQSVVIYDSEGNRQIHTDLKNVNEMTIPEATFKSALTGCSLAILTNIGFSKKLVALTREAGVQIATDLHTISDLKDPYNHVFMAGADILFMSGEKLPDVPEVWARLIQKTYDTAIIVIGLGAEGALLAVKQDNFMERIPAQSIRPVVNTIGAGDALFSSFNHFYGRTGNPYSAIQKAIIFASYKIGATGAAEGFLTESELTEILPDPSPD